MTGDEFMIARGELRKRLEEFEKTLQPENEKIHEEFMKANTSIEVGKVYNFEGGNPTKRVIVYSLDVDILMKNPIIRAGTWELDKLNVPKKWRTYTVYGIGNPAKLVLSENQKNEPHPYSKKEELFSED